MLNVMKMDLYRLFKSRMAWIMLLILYVMTVTTMFTQHSDYELLRSDPAFSEQFLQRFPVMQSGSGEEVVDTYYMFSHVLQSSIGYAIAFLVVLFTVLFAGAENSSGFIKNIAGQPSIRHRTILSKCLSIFVFSGMALLSIFIAALFGSQVFFGYIYFGMYALPDVLLFWLAQWLLNAALGIVILCLSELIKNQAVSTAIGAMLSIGVARLITNNLDDYFQFSNFSFNSLLITFTKEDLPIPLNGGAYEQALALGCVYILLAVAVSILSMKKRDL